MVYKPPARSSVSPRRRGCAPHRRPSSRPVCRAARVDRHSRPQDGPTCGGRRRAAAAGTSVSRSCERRLPSRGPRACCAAARVSSSSPSSLNPSASQLGTARCSRSGRRKWVVLGVAGTADSTPLPEQVERRAPHLCRRAHPDRSEGRRRGGAGGSSGGRWRGLSCGSLHPFRVLAAVAAAAPPELGHAAKHATGEGATAAAARCPFPAQPMRSFLTEESSPGALRPPAPARWPP